MNPDNPLRHREPGPVGQRIRYLSSRVRSLTWRCFQWDQATKSEYRDSKPERNPKPEARRKPSPSLSFSLLVPWLFALLALTTGAAVPSPEQLLPDDTLIMVTAPDFTKLRAICQKSPKSQLWSDPAMKPLRDKFESRWQEEVVKTIARELNVSLDSYASLPQGQLTFAVTKNAWQGNDDQPLGFLLLLDVRDKVSLLKTNLADFRKQWVGAGKTFKTETIRNLEFTVFPVTTNDVPKTLSKFLWRPAVFAPVSSGPDKTFLVKVTTAGKTVWMRSQASPSNPLGVMAYYGIVKGPAGSMYLSGREAPSATDTDILVEKRTSAGKVAWSADFGWPDGGDDDAGPLALDRTAGLYVCGEIWTTNNFYDATLQKFKP